MQVYKPNEDGFWEAPEGEAKARARYSYRIHKDFPFPQEVSSDLCKVFAGFKSESISEDIDSIPPYILAVFGLYRENYPDKDEWVGAVYDSIRENFGYPDFNYANTVCWRDKKTGLTRMRAEHINLPFVSRILATILAHHGVDEIYTIEASRLYCEPEYDENDVFGGEVWAIGPNRVVSMSTDDIVPQLAEAVKNDLSTQSSPRMGM